MRDATGAVKALEGRRRREPLCLRGRLRPRPTSAGPHDGKRLSKSLGRVDDLSKRKAEKLKQSLPPGTHTISPLSPSTRNSNSGTIGLTISDVGKKNPKGKRSA